MSTKVTENAFRRINELIKLEKSQDLAFRIEVIGGGCSGLSYNFTLVPTSEIAQAKFYIEKELPHPHLVFACGFLTSK